MSRLTDARRELRAALAALTAAPEAERVSRQETVNDLRGEIAYLVPLYVRRYQAAMAFRTAEQAHAVAGTDATYEAASAAYRAHCEAIVAVDREQS